MITNVKTRHVVGYIVGFTVFIIVIPLIIYLISEIDTAFLQLQIIKIQTLRIIVSSVLFTVGFIFAVWSNIDLFFVGKGGPTDVFNVEISPRSKKLVITGPYKYTRNPMVFGINSIYIGLAVILNSLASLIFCTTFLTVIVIYLKKTEEKRLLKDFGDEYRQYKGRVAMIIPFLKLKKNNN